MIMEVEIDDYDSDGVCSCDDGVCEIEQLQNVLHICPRCAENNCSEESLLA